ncbi:MAG: acyltransferase [Ruminococcaceae bacterium]|nr:acyltransferase [Oscillospiraceae bacterium]
MKLWEIISFFQYGDLPTSYFVKRGMKVGKNFNRQSGTRMDPSHCWLISIGDDVTLANKVQILAHDDTTRIYTGYGRVAPVKIGDRVFIGANSTILMNTTIGNDVIIGAGSLVTGNIPDDSIAVGVPARVVGKTSEYIAKQKEKMANGLVFDSSYTYQKDVTAEKKEEMLKKLEEYNGVGYLDIGYFEDGKK